MEITMDEFKRDVMLQFKNFLPEEFQVMKLEIYPIVKGGRGTLNGLTMNGGKEKRRVVPILYLEDYLRNAAENITVTLAELAKDGLAISPAVEKMTKRHVITDTIYDMATDFQKAYSEIKEKGMDMENPFLRENILKNVFPYFVNCERNKEMLSYMPYQRFFDLAICYRVKLPEISASYSVNSKLLIAAGVSETEIFCAAEKNINEAEVIVENIAEMMSNILGQDPNLSEVEFDIPMVVITNPECNNGAACVMNKAAMDQVCQMLGGPVYLLPASVHEMIAVPQQLTGTSDHDKRGLVELVQEVNQSVCRDYEILTDNVYTYDAKTKEYGAAVLDKNKEIEKKQDISWKRGI